MKPSQMSYRRSRMKWPEESLTQRRFWIQSEKRKKTVANKWIPHIELNQIDFFCSIQYL